MSLHLSTTVWNTPTKDPLAKLVLACLADYANENCICWPAVQTIARRCDLSPRSVQKIIRRLEKNHFLKAQFSKGKRSNNYTLTLNNGQGITPSTGQGKSVQPRPLDRDTPSNRQGQPCPTRSDTLSIGHPNRKEPVPEPSLNQKSALTSGTGKINGAQQVTFQKEFDRVVEKMQLIKSTYADHQSWSQDDANLYTRLRDRRKELKELLGISF